MYYGTLKVYEDFIGVYCRVSSSTQKIEKQIALADAYLNTQNISKVKVSYFLDDDVSANKLALKDRPKLLELLEKVKLGQIKTILVSHRDRLARNFYEYISIIKVFYEYGVNVVFTSTGQPEFSRVLAMESLYGIFAQTEGQNISGRLSDVRKMYPTNIFGFIRLGKRKETTYKPDPKYLRDLKSFFYSVIKTEDVNDLYKVFMDYKTIFKNKKFEDLYKYLHNPFYAGRLKTQYGYDVLPHVEPILSFNEFEEMQLVLDKHRGSLLNAISKSTNNGLIHPLCSICQTKMQFKSSQLGESGYYVCRNRKHSEVKISVEEYNQLISSQLTMIIESISTKKIKTDVYESLYRLKVGYEQKLKTLERELKYIQKMITDMIGPDGRNISKDLITKSRNIKNLISMINVELIQIEEAKKGVNNVVHMIKNRLPGYMTNYEVNFLAPLFFSTIEIDEDNLIYHVTFGEYIEERGRKSDIGA